MSTTLHWNQQPWVWAQTDSIYTTYSLKIRTLHKPNLIYASSVLWRVDDVNMDLFNRSKPCTLRENPTKIAD